MSRRRERPGAPNRARIGAIVLATWCVATSCSGASRTASEPPPGAILVGAFDFTESEVLAHIYAGALDASGYPVHVLDRVASREIMEPALEQGHVDLVPEYQGTLLRFLDPQAASSVGGNADHAPEELRALTSLLETRGIVALEPAPATNSNVVVVTKETATRLDLSRISDLAHAAGDLIFGGPPECPTRPLCLVGLEDTYGLNFESFQPLDVGGPLTLGALLAGDIDVGLLFETDPGITRHDLVVLRDDLHLQPAENVLPVLREAVLEEHGEGLVQTLNDVSAEITTSDLRRLNAEIVDEGTSPNDAARRWLEERGLS